MKVGTRVMFDGKSGPEYAGVVLRWHPISGKREDVPGYERVRFNDGGIKFAVLVHESRLVAA